MGNFPDTHQFHWDYTEEPHKSRRIEILRKYPEIKTFMKAEGDRRTIFKGLFILSLQFLMACVHYNIPYVPVRIFLSLAVGSFITTALMIHSHEAAHGLIFGPNHVWKNRLYGILLNFGIGMPFYSHFKKFHKQHHKYIGDEILDSEYPTEFESRFFPNTAVGKFTWFLCQPFIYFMRTPLLVAKKPYWWLDVEELLNDVIVFIFYICVAYSRYVKVLNYLGLSFLVATAGNLFGFWGVTSHIEYFNSKETCSYYGWLNMFYLNFGYHMEHHDFPNIPSRYLPKVKEIAGEFYEDQFVFDSFYTAAIKFIFDAKLGIFSRVKRKNLTPWKYEQHCMRNT